MLLKRNRIDKKTMDQIFKDGSFVVSPFFTFKFLINNKTEKKLEPRMAFVVPKTVSKKAVVRNLLRRRGYAVIREYLKDFPLGFVGAFVFNKKAINIFTGRKNKKNNPILNLNNEINNIIKKINFKK